MSTALHRLKEELLAVIPPTLFFFIALHIVALERALLLKGTGIAPSSSMSILVAALILGKSVLIADLLPFINRFPEKPLVYNVAWKTVIYLIISALIHYAERLYDFAREAGGIAAGNAKLLSELVWPHFLAVQILLLVMILMYCAAREFIRVLGAEKVKRIFFGPMPASQVPLP